MQDKMVFGNLKYNTKLEVGAGCGLKLLANIGHMDDKLSFEDELKKAEIAVKYQVDILADNTITDKSFSYKKWIKNNLPVILNTVPIYDCFDAMENGKFEYSMLEEAIDKHIAVGSDMLVLHPSLTRALANEVFRSKRIVKVTSRGGSQVYRYILKYNRENPYFEHWDEICDKIAGTGVAIAIGLSLRSGSILDDMDENFIKELDIAGRLVERAQKKKIPIVIEGIGHVQTSNMKKLFEEVRCRCHNIPIKTLGPLLSDRMIGNEHINSLLGSYCAADAGAAIVGALFRSEHLGLPNVQEYEESLINYSMLKYIVNMSKEDIEAERQISVARSNRDWRGVLEKAFYQEEAVRQFHCRYGKNTPDTCTMCGERCAMKNYKIKEYEILRNEIDQN